MLLINTTPLLLIQNLITASCGMYGVGAAMIGFCLAPMNWVERAVFFGAGLLLIDPGALTDLAGLSILALCMANQVRKKRALAAEVAV